MGGSIHADDRKGCKCGGKFNKYIAFVDEYKEPVCSSCNGRPLKYRIVRYLPSINGGGEPYTIRYTKTEDRIDHIIKAVFTLQAIDSEIESGIFNPYHYSQNRRKLLFKDMYKAYLEERSAHIAPKTYKHKLLYYRKYLSVLDEKLVHHINKADILKIQQSITAKRSSDLVVQELKVFLNWCVSMDIINARPQFPKTSSSKKVSSSSIPSLDEYRAIRDEMTCDIGRMIMDCWLVYPLRRCEILVLKYSDIDFKRRTLTIQRHYSDNKIIDGRKSQKLTDELGRLELELSDKFIDAISSKPIPVNTDQYIFEINGKPIRDRHFSKLFIEARKKAGLDHVKAGKIRHAKGSEIYSKSGDIKLTQSTLGHTNSKTTMDRYTRSLKRQVDYL